MNVKTEHHRVNVINAYSTVNSAFQNAVYAAADTPSNYRGFVSVILERFVASVDLELPDSNFGGFSFKSTTSNI